MRRALSSLVQRTIKSHPSRRYKKTAWAISFLFYTWSCEIQIDLSTYVRLTPVIACTTPCSVADQCFHSFSLMEYSCGSMFVSGITFSKAVTMMFSLITSTKMRWQVRCTSRRIRILNRESEMVEVHGYRHSDMDFESWDWSSLAPHAFRGSRLTA